MPPRGHAVEIHLPDRQYSLDSAPYANPGDFTPDYSLQIHCSSSATKIERDFIGGPCCHYCLVFSLALKAHTIIALQPVEIVTPVDFKLPLPR